jgi:hypothetical protein
VAYVQRGWYAAAGRSSRMGSDPPPVVKDLDGGLGCTHVDLFLHELMGDTVVVLVELDVVVDVDACFLPDREFVGFLWKRLESRLVQLLEELATRATEVFHLPGVGFVEQLTDGLVQVSQAEEGVVAQTSKDPALDHLDAHFDLGLVFGLTNAGGDDGRTVVLGQVMVGGIQIRLVATRVFAPSFEIVRDYDLGHPAQESEHTNVGANPVGQILAPMGLGVGAVAGAQHADEDLGIVDLARVWVNDGDRLTGRVDKDLLSTLGGEAHRWLQALGPLPIEGTELAVAIAVRMGFAILDRQQA